AVARSVFLSEGIVKRSHLISGVLVILLAAAVGSLPLGAQQFYGTITGTVTDPTGAVVANATVKVTNVNTNITVLSKTNGAGVYVANSLIVGTYRVQVEASGFKKAIADKINLEVGATPKVDLALTVGQSSETVEVTAANAPILQTEQTDLGQTIGATQLQQLPTQGGTRGRSPYSFLQLAAGVTQQFGC